jgi:DNA-binding NarL/FixJ family response regulator
MANEAVEQARQTNDRVSELSTAAARIGDVVARVSAALGEISHTHGGIPTDLWNQAHLTGREWEVLERIALGESAKEIAQALGLSSRTVEGYRANILRKAGVRSTTELVRRVFGRCRS